MDDFFAATLNLLETVCLNAKWCLPLMDFSSDGLSNSIGNKKVTIFDYYVQIQPLPINGWFFWSHWVQMQNGVCLSYQWWISLQMVFLPLLETKRNYFWPLCHHTAYAINGWNFWSHFDSFIASLFKCQMVSAFDGFLFRWSISCYWTQKRNYFLPLCHDTATTKKRLIFLEPLGSNAKWCLPFIPKMDFASDGLSPSVGNKKSTIF